MSDIPLDCAYELASDPLITYAARMSSALDRLLREGRKLDPSAFFEVDRAELAAKIRRTVILAKYGITDV